MDNYKNCNFYTECCVYMNTNHLIICPKDEPHEILIDRSTLDVTSVSVPGRSIDKQNGHYDAIRLGNIRGIVGIKHLVKRSYLLAINESSKVDAEGLIYKIDSVSIFPIQDVTPRPGDSYREVAEWEWEKIYIKMITDLFGSNSFYYSHRVDLTRSMQKSYKFHQSNHRHENYYNYTDTRFQFNYKLLEPFEAAHQNINRCRLPIIMGFITEEFIEARGRHDSACRWRLISRRAVRMAGTRFNRRGVDDEGNVANFVETEQIVIPSENDSITSFLQVRGSIPMYWSQTPTYKYKPEIELHNRDHYTAMRRHLVNLEADYGSVTVVSLIDQKGHEAKLAQEFKSHMTNGNFKGVHFHDFDFHKICGKANWNNVSLLINKLIGYIEQNGLFVQLNNDAIYQKGVIRTNCIDSLDRTNLVQSKLASVALKKQLDYCSIAEAGFDNFKVRFANAWADNANALSIQYAGTPALKTDFTRTGKRTYSGMLQDGLNSMQRYVANNYLDSYRQDSVDLLLCNFVGYPSPTYRPLDLASYSSTFPVAIIMLTLVALYVYFRHDSLRWLES